MLMAGIPAGAVVPRSVLAAAVVVECCGAYLLAVGVLGGLAVGGLFGAGVGVEVAVLLVGAALVVRRRRRVTCEPVSRKSVGHDR